MRLDADLNFEPEVIVDALHMTPPEIVGSWRDLPKAFSRGESTLPTRHGELQANSLSPNCSIRLRRSFFSTSLFLNVSVSASPMLRVATFINHHTGSTLPIARCTPGTEGVADM
ncbi:hypothetical protein PPGU19_089530 (plasmid) [Paraburkholderia sp. PGU19]|nr:hypothetical protein PPGU19_089530 [Paraburkholderia sp. PGU19]